MGTEHSTDSLALEFGPELTLACSSRLCGHVEFHAIHNEHLMRRPLPQHLLVDSASLLFRLNIELQSPPP